MNAIARLGASESGARLVCPKARCLDSRMKTKTRTGRGGQKMKKLMQTETQTRTCRSEGRPWTISRRSMTSTKRWQKMAGWTRRRNCCCRRCCCCCSGRTRERAAST